MTPEEFRTFGYAAIDWIAHYLENTRSYPVLPAVEPGSLIDALPAAGPEEPEDMGRILEDFEREIVPRTTLWNHPRFLGYFSNSSPPEGILAELLATALNPNAMLWKASPASTELEQLTLRWFLQWLGLPNDWFGQILDTASTSTFHAIVAARVRKGHVCADDTLTLYASVLAHSSIPKGATAAGIARENIRLIPVDEQYRMDTAALEAAVQADLANGKVPFCVIPTVGTTSVASVDPVRATVEIARRYGLWVHVDAAYGGSTAIHEEYRVFLDAVSEADSLVINPHKWLFVPMDLSILYCRNAAWMRDAFSLTPEYLRTEENPRALNLNEYGLPLGRRFRSLKLWFVMRANGRVRLAQRIHQQILDAKRLATQIAAHPDFEVCAPVHFSLVVFRHKAGDSMNDRLLSRANQSGQMLLSPNVLDGKKVIRLAIGNYLTAWEDLEAVWSFLVDEAQEALRESVGVAS
jgi:aromatic-L-amino-acid decarboxylase